MKLFASEFLLIRVQGCEATFTVLYQPAADARAVLLLRVGPQSKEACYVLAVGKVMTGIF